MKSANFLILILFCVSVSPVLAQTSKLSTSWETGKMSTSEILEDEDISADFTYYKYHFNINQELTKQLNWTLSNILYRKEFDGQPALSNRFNQAMLSIDYLPKMDSVFIPTELRFKYLNKEKEYKHLPEDKYKQNNLELGAIYENDKKLRLAVITGANDFDYKIQSEKDEAQFYLNIDVRKNLYEGRLTLYGLAKIKNIKRNHNSDKNQNIWGAQADYKLGLPYFKEISLSVQKGKSETLDEEERDDKYDFKYVIWQVKTKHPILDNLDVSFRYQRTKRSYLKWDKSWQRMLLENTTQYKIIDDKTKDLILNLKTYHKKLDFVVVNTNDFTKDGASLELKFNKKGSYKIGCSFGFNRKQSELAPLKNRDAYTWKASLEKTLSNLTLFLDYKHEFKDYEYNYDRAYDVIKCGVELKF